MSFIWQYTLSRDGHKHDFKTGFHAMGCNFTAKIDTVSDESEKVYYIKDHLGSVRVAVNATGEVTAAQDYYAYGEILRGYAAGSGNNDRYKFTEKERDAESDYDYFPPGRYYDSERGQWLQTDPLTDLYPGLSSYNYCGNNPVNNFDPDGKMFVPAEYANEEAMLKALGKEEEEDQEEKQRQPQDDRQKKNKSDGKKNPKLPIHSSGTWTAGTRLKLLLGQVVEIEV